MGSQTQIPGTERTRDKKCTQLANKYREVRDARMDLTKKEVVAKAALADYMLEKKMEHYIDEDSDLDVRVEAKTNVKVRRCDTPDEEENEDS